jgi:hypothetical protein
MRSILLLLVLCTAGCSSAAEDAPSGSTSGTTAGTTSDAASDATTSDSAPVATSGSAEVTLAPGETKRAGGIDVSFDHVVGDSRCPTDVTCAWEGDADLLFLLSAVGEQPKEAHLHTSRRDATEVTYAGRIVSLVRVTPATHSQRQIAAGDYRATVAVK